VYELRACIEGILINSARKSNSGFFQAAVFDTEVAQLRSEAKETFQMANHDQ
jgi:hypothetical protein